MIFLELFLTFFKIGISCFGGGYAMISYIQMEVVTKREWLSLKDFTDIVAISQITPGPLGINIATYTGYTASGGTFWGSLIATVALCIPSFFIMLLVTRYLLKYRHHPAVETIFKALHLIILGLMASAALQLMTPHNFTDRVSVVLAVAAFVAGFFLKVHPVKILLAAGVLGYLLY